MPKQSFFARLAGLNEVEDVAEAEDMPDTENTQRSLEKPSGTDLRVDVFQIGDVIVLKAFTPGVHPGDVELSLTRDMLTIIATREESDDTVDEDYFTRELDWSTLERTILLPIEIDIDQAEATESHGVLTIRLPKVNKDRQRVVKVTKGNKQVVSV
jgi:HSP20 family protein